MAHFLFIKKQFVPIKQTLFWVSNNKVTLQSQCSFQKNYKIKTVEL